MKNGLSADPVRGMKMKMSSEIFVLFFGVKLL